MRREVDIDCGHDVYTVSSGEIRGEVDIVLWSRGSFGVTVSLMADEADAVADALREVAADVRV